MKTLVAFANTASGRIVTDGPVASDLYSPDEIQAVGKKDMKR